MQNQRLEKLLTFNKRKNFLKSCGIEHFHIVKEDEDAYRYFFKETYLSGRCEYNFYRGNFYRGNFYGNTPYEEDEAVEFFINYCTDYFDFPAIIRVPVNDYDFFLYVNKIDKKTLSNLIKNCFLENKSNNFDYIFISSDGTYVNFMVFEYWVRVTKYHNKNLNFSTAVMAEFLAAEDD